RPCACECLLPFARKVLLYLHRLNRYPSCGSYKRVPRLAASSFAIFSPPSKRYPFLLYRLFLLPLHLDHRVLDRLRSFFLSTVATMFPTYLSFSDLVSVIE